MMIMSKEVRFLTIINISLVLYVNSSDSNKYDVLNPYEKKFGGRLSHRQVRDCHPIEYGTVPYEMDTVTYHKNTNPSSQNSEVRSFLHNVNGISTGGHVAFVNNPINLFSVEEPLNGGCNSNKRSKVAETARHFQCFIAVNAGFFNTDTGHCYGNVVSNGKLVRDSGGVQNANFGITKENKIFIGYLPLELLRDHSKGFKQLISGVIWLVRKGKVFINNSKEIECEDTQSTGKFDSFINVRSARTAVGYDKTGRIIIAQVNGKTNVYGINLWEMANLMIQFGAVNAINLDGGGSSTFVVNGTVVNQLSDECEDANFRCERSVTTILCLKKRQNFNNHDSIKNAKTKECDSLSKESDAIKMIKITYVSLFVFASVCLVNFIVNIILCFKILRMKRFPDSPVVRYSHINAQSSEDEEMESL